MSRNEKTALVVVIVSIGAVLLSVFAGLGYYGFKRYMDRARESRRELERRITVDSTTDATADIVDEDYRFKVAYPGPGFKLMGEEHASRIHQDAIAAAMGDSCWFAVTVEHLPGGNLDDVTTAYVEAMQAADKKVASRDETTLGGKPARSVVVDALVQGMPFRYRQLIVANDGWFIRVMAWAQLGPFGACSAVVDRTFSILPGPVKARAHGVKVTESVRSAYRVRGRTFESPSYRLQVEVPDGFRLEQAPEALTYEPYAAVALTKGTIIVAIGTEPAPRPSVTAPVEAATKAYAQSLGPLLPDRWKKKIGDTDITLRTFDGSKPFRTAWGMAHVDGLWVHVRMLYPEPLTKNADEALDAALAGVRILGKAEAAKLAGDLPKVDDTSMSPVGESLRAGVYTDYVHQFRVRLPQDPILPTLEPELVGVGGVAALFLRPGTGASTAIVTDTHKIQGGGPDGMVNAASLVSGLPAADLHPTPVEGAPPGVRHAHLALIFQNGERGRYDMHEIVGQDLVFVTYGLEPNIDAASTATEAIVRGFERDTTLVEHDLSSKRLRNNRIGFQLDLPGGGFTSKIVDMGATGGLFTFYQAENDAIEVGVLALSAQFADIDFVLPVFEQTMAERMPAKGAPARKNTRLGSLDARHLVWDSGFEMAIAGQGTRFFAVFVGPRRGGTVDSATVFKGFRLD